jgi:hypothetical protein
MSRDYNPDEPGEFMAYSVCSLACAGTARKITPTLAAVGVIFSLMVV